METTAKVRKWGSSMAVIIPKNVVKAKQIKENDELVLEIKKRPLAGTFFGIAPKTLKKTTQEIKDEMRKGW